MEIKKLLALNSREQWHDWLEAHHALEKEVWLVHFKKHTGKTGFTYEDAVQEALCFGWIDGILKRIDDQKYALRYSPRKSKSIWSESNRIRVEQLIKEGKMTEAGMIKIRDAKANGEWDKSIEREKNLSFPEDLARALSGNKEALKNFEIYSPSLKKRLIWWITEAKREETRRKRIEKVVDLAEADEKPGM